MHVAAASFVRSLATEDVAGDGCLVDRWARGVLVAIADGLGHGRPAADASASFLQIVRDARDRPLSAVLEEAHRALARGRGAVAAIARFDEVGRSVEVAGLGNIGIFVASDRGEVRHVVIPAGVLGSAFRTIRPQVIEFAEGDTLVLHTDGVSSRFPFHRLRTLEPQALARAVVTTYGKASDDAACAVAVGMAAIAKARSDADDGQSLELDIRVESDSERAAVAARAFADRSGFGVKAQWQLGIAAAELATRVLRSGLASRMTLRLERGPREQIVVAIVDRTPETEGRVGLESVRRMMDDVTTATDASGTRIVARKLRAPV